MPIDLAHNIGYPPLGGSDTGSSETPRERSLDWNCAVLRGVALDLDWGDQERPGFAHTRGLRIPRPTASRCSLSLPIVDSPLVAIENSPPSGSRHQVTGA